MADVEAKDLLEKWERLFKEKQETVKSKLNLEFEVLPYKSLDEVADFLAIVAENRLPKWMENVSAIVPGTSYCYNHGEILNPDRKPLDRAKVPKTMVCHDYKGNYLEDRLVDYSWDARGNVYQFTQWSLVDSFVYFSHSLVTVPPPCWINAGHAHGTQVMGTLITEGKSGKKLWDLVLVTPELWEWFADALVLINKVHRFDGYLVNVENSLDSQQVPKMLNFIKRLKSRLPENSLVIWYDSVTYKGDLSWQNALNDKNLDFFTVCDGIYLNYNYQKWQLENSAILAGNRTSDVYVGIDVFGRGCPGSGFFSSEAAAMARQYDLSIAVFAPGWTKERVPIQTELSENKKCGINWNAAHQPVTFEDINNLFWMSLSRFLFVHGTSENRRIKHIVGGVNSTNQRPQNWIDDERLHVIGLLPPPYDETRQHKALLTLQEAVVTFNCFKKNVYEEIHQPAVKILYLANGNKSLFVNTKDQVDLQTIPLMFLEQPFDGGFKIDVLSKIESTNLADPFAYVNITLPDQQKTTKLIFPILLSSDWITSTFSKEGRGTIMEVGIIAASTIMSIQHFQVTTSF